jgi:hypothetical protein
MIPNIIPCRVSKKRTARTCIGVVFLALASMAVVPIMAQDTSTGPVADPHYNDVGFFDIHICNWPDRPLHIMALFSTTHFNDLDSVEISMPNQKSVGHLELNKFRLIQTKDKKEKRVFIKRFDMPSVASDGWFSAKIKMKNGKTYIAKDYVVIHTMPWVTNINPPNGAENIPIPAELSWQPIPGAKYYQVFIRDVWKAKLVYTSKLLDKPHLKLPKGLIEPGGEYEWLIHAREGGENTLLGDFNHGSLTNAASFSVTD